MTSNLILLRLYHIISKTINMLMMMKMMMVRTHAAIIQDLSLEDVLESLAPLPPAGDVVVIDLVGKSDVSVPVMLRVELMVVPDITVIIKNAQLIL